MTTLEYKTLIVPVNLLYTLEDFSEAVKSDEVGWEKGLANLLKVCEDKELYEYCTVIKKELDKRYRRPKNE